MLEQREKGSRNAEVLIILTRVVAYSETIPEPRRDVGPVLSLALDLCPFMNMSRGESFCGLSETVAGFTVTISGGLVGGLECVARSLVR